MVLRLCLSTRLGFRKSFARSKTTVFGRAFYKKLVVSRGKAFGRSSQRAKSFIVRRSLGELENLFAREKVLENQLSVESNLKNYPVDDF